MAGLEDPLADHQGTIGELIRENEELTARIEELQESAPEDAGEEVVALEAQVADQQAEFERLAAELEDAEAAETSPEEPTLEEEPEPAPPPPPPPPAEDAVVTSFSGSGQHATRPFTVADGWEIQWSSDDLLQIYVYTASGDLEGVTADQSGGGDGSSFPPRGGEFYLEMNALGRWAVDIVQVAE